MEESNVWYSNGLRFSCQQCGKCCSGAPGFVWVTDQEIGEMAKEMGISRSEFEVAFVRLIKGRAKSLREREDGDCVLLNEETRRCILYKTRPTQCRTWPFWFDNIASQKAWKKTVRSCPGCDRPDGKLYTVAEIVEQRDQKF
ncbi:MAG: YkgJ family cysteine cluster protein [Planctomycetia bacterium]|nr:YkgJ family cysteine cluster protein [Planctomycetia bacterium]